MTRLPFGGTKVEWPVHIGNWAEMNLRGGLSYSNRLTEPNYWGAACDLARRDS